MAKHSPNDSPCPIGRLLEVLTRPWTLHILWALSMQGPMRFGVLRQRVEGISARVLTERLRGLEAEGFIYRNYEPTIPPAVTYGITKRMKDIEKVLVDLQRLAEQWNKDEAGSREAGRVQAASAASR